MNTGSIATLRIPGVWRGGFTGDPLISGLFDYFGEVEYFVIS